MSVDPVAAHQNSPDRDSGAGVIRDDAVTVCPSDGGANANATESVAASTAQNPADEVLIERLTDGDEAAFDEIVHRYAPRLLRVCFGLCGRAEDAEDLMQETLTNAYLRIDSFAGRSSFFTWLYRIAVNRSISRHRKRRIESTHTGHSLDEQTFGLHSDSPTAETLAQQAEDAAQVRQAIEQLPDDRRAVLVLRDMDGLDYSDIAEILEIPKGTVRSRLHRARADLREILEQSP